MRTLRKRGREIQHAIAEGHFRRQRRALNSHARVERLERRCLLAAYYDPEDFFLADSDEPGSPGIIQILFDDDDDAVSFENAPGSIARLTVNGTSYDYAANQINGISLGMGGGNDTVVIASDVSIPATINGDAGDDSLVGGAGDDWLLGGYGNDTLQGGTGNDDLVGSESGAGVHNGSVSVWGPPSPANSRDSMDGGTGDDTLRGNSQDDTMIGGAGNNEILEQSNLNYLDVLARDGDDVVTVGLLDSQTVRINANGLFYDFSLDLTYIITVKTGPGNDLVQIDPEVLRPVWLFGEAGNDTLIGGSLGDTIVGGSGSDSIDGTTGDDLVYGDQGDPNLLSNPANDGLPDESDTVSGGSGDDTLFGEGGDDSLAGGDGNDSILGGDGDDTLGDGMGDDTLDGGAGADEYGMTPGSDDLVIDSGGHDRLNFSRAARGITIDLGLGSGRRQGVDAAGNTITLRGAFEDVIGSSFADDLIGNGQPNRLDGGGGDDTLDGGGGDRSLHGRGGSPQDRRAGNGCDGDILVGGDGQDWLDGGRGPDQLDGGNDDDTLVGDGTRDVLTGGAGSNRTIAVSKTGVDCPVIGAALSSPPIFFDSLSGTLTGSLGTGAAGDHVIAVTVTASGFVEVTADGVVHSSDPDSASFDAFLEGATGDSVLAILLAGNGGNDTLSVGDGFATASGQITLDGGAGNDSLVGSSSDEMLLGGPGNDTLSGGAGADTLIGGTGNDSLDGGVGTDLADFSAATRGVKVNLARGTSKSRGEGSDRLAALENVIGSNFNDVLVGDALSNLLLGGDGNDTIRGGDGPDTLRGGAGNDRLAGDSGADMVIGNAGSDRLLIDAQSDQLVTDLLDKLQTVSPRRSARRR